MSLCRFSCDNFKCDLYAYESEEGFMIHVADARPSGRVPKITADPIKDPDKFFKQHDKQHRFLDKCKYKKINLKYAGTSFVVQEPEEFLAKLKELKKIGYRFPDHVLEVAEHEAGGSIGKH